jgi:Protein of unknown function, DUF481
MIGLRFRTGAHRAAALVLAASWLLVPFTAASEARLGAKGDVLHGEVVDLTPDGVVFELIQGEGKVKVPWADVETLETDDDLIVMYGDEGEVHGRVVGVEGGAILVGSDRATAQRIEVETMFAAESMKKYGGSLRDRVRSRFRYWTASLSAGASYTDATTDTLLGTIGVFIDRRKDPTYLLIQGEARYGNQKQDGEGRTLTDGLAWGFVRGEYDFYERLYGYTSTRATYDDLQNLSLRLEPRGGAGVHIIKSSDFNFSSDLGVAWVYENYFGSEPVIDGFPLPKRGRRSQSFWAVAFGVQADAKLPYGIKWRARGDYLPAADDWTGEYLLRGETSLDFPLLDWLAFRISVTDDYDNTPGEGTQRNRFTSTAGLSFGFP